MLNYLPSAYYRLARFPEAISAMEVALTVRRRLGSTQRPLSTLWNLGVSYAANGDHRLGKAKFDEAFGMIRGAGDIHALTESVEQPVLRVDRLWAGTTSRCAWPGCTSCWPGRRGTTGRSRTRWGTSP